MELREEFKKGLIWQPRDGKTVKFWKDKWTKLGPLEGFALRPHLINPEATVSDYISEEKKWKLDYLASQLPPQICKHITDIPLPIHLIQDRLYWDAQQKWMVFYGLGTRTDYK